MSMPERPPFDEEDAETARRYLRSRDLTEFDPFAADNAAEDMIFTTSLAVARHMMEESFATKTTGGRRFRGYPVFVDRSSPNAFGFAALPKTLRRKLVLFACMMMTFLFDQSAARQGSAATGTHPLAYHRLHNLVRTLASNLSDPSGSTTALFDDVLGEVTRLKERVPQLFSPAQLLHDLRTADLQAAFDRVEEALQTARGHFAPFAFRHAPDPSEAPNSTD